MGARSPTRFVFDFKNMSSVMVRLLSLVVSVEFHMPSGVLDSLGHRHRTAPSRPRAHDREECRAGASG